MARPRSIRKVASIGLLAPLVGLALAVSSLAAQSDASSSGPLYDELARMDSLIFDASFVSCNADVANAIFSEDIEFYHDQGGAAIGEQVRESTRNLTKGCPRTKGVRRELVPGSLRVYPIKDYGAVQVGEHRFVEKGAPSSTAARFVHLWRKRNGSWQVTRVLSFDHQPIPAVSR
jgi:hypothetical protein